jgi:hypothetical protein
VRRAAARSQCANNLKQLALGLHAFATTHPVSQGKEETRPLLPPGTVYNINLAPERRLSWVVDVLPLVEQDTLARRIDRQAAWDSTRNLPATQAPLRIMWCPDWSREAGTTPEYLTTYVGMAGVGPDAVTLAAGDHNAGVFGYDRRTALTDIADGTANTLLILESARDNGPWAQGGPATVRGLDPATRPYLGTGRPFGGTHFTENTLFRHGKSFNCQAAMADGSVHSFHDAVAGELLEALATIAGGENLGGDW